jgi:uncharacterized protein YuzE
MLSSIDLLRRSGYEVKYFSDTDTALVEFTENEIAETREISENFYVDLDRQRNPVSMTIEHARTNARLQEFWYQEVPRPPQEESRST